MDNNGHYTASNLNIDPVPDKETPESENVKEVAKFPES